ncbi:MAG: PqqD family peptide modification chaperone [Candidatus Korarchaeota archaeon]
MLFVFKNGNDEESKEKESEDETAETAQAYYITGVGDLSGHRFMIRKENYGGIIVVDASRLLYLNKTAMEIIVEYLKGKSEDEIVSSMLKRYRVKEEVVRHDVKELLEKITTFVKQPDVFPVEEYQMDKFMPFEAEISAPYRMDLALTYRCNNNCMHCYVPSERRANFTELSTESWKKILDTLSKVGVPHVTFTGGEPTLRQDLAELIEYSNDLGIICGLITNGRLLKDASLVERIVRAGVDYVQVTLESADKEIHDKMVGVKGAWEETVQGLKNLIPTDIFTHTNTTLTRLNVGGMKDLVRFVAELGLDTIAMNAIIYSGDALNVPDIALSEDELNRIIPDIVFEAHNHDLRIWWYSPMAYCKFNPLEYGLGARRCSAAYSSMAIEPNGDVIPCQSYFKPLGNILSDEWEKIWNHSTAKYLRERKWLSGKCKDCELVKLCGGGCPLTQEYVQQYVCKQRL